MNKKAFPSTAVTVASVVGLGLGMTALAARKRRETHTTNALKAVQSASRAKDQLLAVFSHELRNPLHAVVTSVEVLHGAAANSTLASHARSVLSRQTGKLTQLLDDLVDAAQVLADGFVLVTQPVQLAGLLNAVAASVHALAARRQQHLQVDAAAALWVLADAPRLARAWRHLLDHALAHTPAGRTLALTLTARHGQAVVGLIDISPDQSLDAAQSMPRGSGGAGAGAGDQAALQLACAEHLITLHGGSLQMRRLPQGQSFECCLPTIAMR